jgi:hypothetical protein
MRDLLVATGPCSQSFGKCGSSRRTGTFPGWLFGRSGPAPQLRLNDVTNNFDLESPAAGAGPGREFERERRVALPMRI